MYLLSIIYFLSGSTGDATWCSSTGVPPLGQLWVASWPPGVHFSTFGHFRTVSKKNRGGLGGLFLHDIKVQLNSFPTSGQPLLYHVF